MNEKISGIVRKKAMPSVENKSLKMIKKTCRKNKVNVKNDVNLHGLFITNEFSIPSYGYTWNIFESAIAGSNIRELSVQNVSCTVNKKGFFLTQIHALVK